MTKAGAAAASDLREALSQVQKRLQSQPSRTWSIIITFYGDALLPRGESLWLGTLHSFFEGLGIADGVIRTAMSRLAADGWLERNKVGRNSFYRLTDKGRAVFAEAAERIYHLKVAKWDGKFVLVIPSTESDRDLLRAALEAADYGAPGPGLWIAPSSWSIPEAAASEITLRADGDPADLRALAARAWPLAEIAEAYQLFISTFAPLLAALEKGATPSDLDAIIARVLMIHEYRSYCAIRLCRTKSCQSIGQGTLQGSSAPRSIVIWRCPPKIGSTRTASMNQVRCRSRKFPSRTALTN